MSNAGFAGRYEEGVDMVSVVNASTGTIERYMCVVSGVAVPFTTTLDVGKDDATTPIPVAPSTALAESRRIVGWADKQIPPGTVGSAIRFGRTFVRVHNGTLNQGQRATIFAGTTGGTIANSTADPCVFYCEFTASTGATVGGVAYTFTVSHALGFANALGCGY